MARALPAEDVVRPAFGTASSSGTAIGAFGVSPQSTGPIVPAPDTLWQPSPEALPTAGNYIYLDSDVGDYIGRGLEYLYTPADAQLTVTASNGHLSVDVNGDEWWNGDFQTMNTINQLQVGYYPDLKRYPFHDPAVGGLNWSGEGRGSNTLTGWFVVDNVTYVDGALTSIDLRFEQHSGGAVPALHGAIHWDTAETTLPPGPVVPAPDDLWQPSPEALPTAGNYIYLDSDTGDYIGQGLQYLYTPSNAELSVTASGGHLAVSVDGAEWWNGDFQTMTTINQLQTGYYPDLQRYPFHNPAKGGLNWSGDGRGSNTLTGWFAVDSATYQDGVLTAIDLRFEQHSEGGVPALHGVIHWDVTDTSTSPGPVSPAPSDLWQPQGVTLPGYGNYIYLDSDAGDYIGQGQEYLYTLANAEISVTASGGHLAVSVDGAEWWNGDFQAMSTIGELEAGYYPDLTRYPFHNPVKGGLNWSGEGRGSNTLTGWFAVDSVRYTNGVLSAIDLRFEQHSEGGVPALHGVIHWDAANPRVAPIPVYRFTDMYNGASLYTSDVSDAIDILNNYSDVYLYEGVAFYTVPGMDTTPIYRLYNVDTYTFAYAGAGEANAIVMSAPGQWANDGVAFYVAMSADSATVPVYRFLGPRPDCHFVTASTLERDTVAGAYPTSMRYEGVLGYVHGGLQLGAGDGSISGRITTAKGVPLSGVWVRASLGDDSGTWFARTDASGAYSVTGLPAGEYLVTASTWPNNFDSGWTIIPWYYPGAVSVTSGANTPNINVQLTRLPQPVYRFYNFTNNTHFFTPSEDEANAVMDQWSDVFEFEGVAYFTNLDNNSQPLYRFYNRKSGSHFYTASAEEANTIIARYSNVFTYDGQTYAVNPAPVPNSVPVYRFFNKTNGSHFYTASAEEADMVRITWPHVYTFEGPAFWIGQ